MSPWAIGHDETSPASACICNTADVGLYFGGHICYNVNKEVAKMEEKRIGRRSLLKHVVIVLLVAILLATGVKIGDVAYTQDESPKDHYLELLSDIAEHLDCLKAVMKELDEDIEARAAFLGMPREYLSDKGVELSPDFYRVVALNFEVGFENEVFQPVEPRGDLRGAAEGIGMFYDKVGLLIQLAVAQDVEDPPVESLLTLLSVIPDDTLNKLPEVMKSLDEQEVDSADRVAFRENPRGFLLRRDITLSSDNYRLVALDFQAAVALETASEGEKVAFHSAEPREGLGVMNEGIGIFYDHVGVFIQTAI